MTVKNPRLAIVIPCYKEEEVLPITSKQFLSQLNSMIEDGLIAEDSKVVFVNDGSTDRTWEIIENLSKKESHYEGISLSRNRGHQNALLGGLMTVKDDFDITISIDCDGQDDISVMTEMVKKYHEGAEIVYGVRSSRETDTGFKRWTAQTYYKVLAKLGTEVVYNHADYRLMSAKALNSFADFKEVNLYLRGLVPMIGYKTDKVTYSRKEREAGESHYPLKKMLQLAIDGITSTSIEPIRLVTTGGVLITFISVIMILATIISKLCDNTVSGWASLMCVILFMGGVQMVSLGIIGEYVGKAYMETKHRPRYIISRNTMKEQVDSLGED